MRTLIRLRLWGSKARKVLCFPVRCPAFAGGCQRPIASPSVKLQHREAVCLAAYQCASVSEGSSAARFARSLLTGSLDNHFIRNRRADQVTEITEFRSPSGNTALEFFFPRCRDDKRQRDASTRSMHVSLLMFLICCLNRNACLNQAKASSSVCNTYVNVPMAAVNSRRLSM